MLNVDGVFSMIKLGSRHAFKMKNEFLIFSTSDSFCLIASHMAKAHSISNMKDFNCTGSEK